MFGVQFWLKCAVKLKISVHRKTCAFFFWCSLSLIVLFSEIERYISVFDHMWYLPPHSKWEQDHPVEEEYRPEDWNIKRTKESHHNCNAKCHCDRVPELELREAANERTELIGSSNRKSRTVSGVGDGGINLRGEETDEKIEDVNAKTVRNDVEAF